MSDAPDAKVDDYNERADAKVKEAKERLAQLEMEGAGFLKVSFEERAKEIVAKDKQRRKKKPRKKKSAATSAPVQVPFWPEPERVSPNAVLRSALFSCSRRSDFVQDALLPSWGDTKISFTGQRLTQFDESVWLQLVHLHRGQSVSEGQQVHSSARALMRGLGLSPGGSGLARLEKSVRRLMGAVVRFERGPHLLLMGGPVRKFGLNQATGRYAVELNPDYLKLLETEEITRLDWETRQALPTGLATWLHRYILSHQATKKSPHRISLEHLHRLSGMGSTLKEFKRTLRRSMGQLEEAGVVATWRITPKGSLEFARPPQRKRLKAKSNSN